MLLQGCRQIFSSLHKCFFYLGKTLIKVGDQGKGDIMLQSIPNIHYGLNTNLVKSMIGEQWKPGKVSVGFSATDSKSFYSWTPGYWASICVDLNSYGKLVYLDGKLGKMEIKYQLYRVSHYRCP